MGSVRFASREDFIVAFSIYIMKTRAKIMRHITETYVPFIQRKAVYTFEETRHFLKIKRDMIKRCKYL